MSSMSSTTPVQRGEWSRSRALLRGIKVGGSEAAKLGACADLVDGRGRNETKRRGGRRDPRAWPIGNSRAA